MCAGAVDGLDFSDDKLLQGRTFSYSDTQRHRVGPNSYIATLETMVRRSSACHLPVITCNTIPA